MRVSRNWLNNYVALGLTDSELAERLTMAGLEVESFESQADNLTGIVVGEVRSVESHPNARKLTVCRVFDGKRETQVVCGAPNVAAGLKIAFAPEGISVRRNQHDPEGGPLTIGRVSLRGIESAGMICSGYELGISDDREGILILDTNAIPGVPLSRELGMDDTLFEIGVTANRPDLLSHIGVAREISANTGKPLKLPRIRVPEGKREVGKALSVRVIDTINCPRYSARVVENVRVEPSPGWLRDSLTSVGIRPVNNVVDITNYVLMEIGQPLHAFDYDRLAGNAIIVRGGGGEKSFVTLDGKRREVREDTLLICDGGGPVALAGVMGGLNSEISARTTSIVIESAYFNPVNIRRTSKRLGLSTEASQRFERGADPNITAWALDRAAQLLSEVAGGTVLRGRIDVYPKKIRETRITFNVKNSNKLLGITLRKTEVSTLFNRIGIKKIVQQKSGGTIYSVPTWRPDITREVDLVEEAARLYGYEKIGTAGEIRLNLGEHAPAVDVADLIRDYLSSSGFREIVTNSMSDRETASHPEAIPVILANPISLDMTALRTSLLQGLLTTIRHNLFHGIDSSRFYEIGSVFRMNPSGDPEIISGYFEEERLCLAMYGLESPGHWEDKPKKVTIFTLKGEANALFRKISLDNSRYIPYSTPTALSERSIFIEIKGERVGSLGLVSSALLKRYDIDTEVFFLDLALDKLRKSGSTALTFRPYSRFPVVRRDLAVIVNESVTIGQIEDAIRAVAGPMLREIILFDIYRGEQAGAGKKSCAFSLEWVSENRTLEQQDILELMGGVTEKLESSLGAVLRQ
ncbi:MAG TPA: phenylalanine--tRNA ligase subunit beta [Bacteroidota bacterium]|nr:phenylalanine--tRNA ligase subunit beta [Bacteroidota bacterium]